MLDGAAPIAVFAVADAVREESRAAVQRLQEQQIEVQMMTGDAEPVARRDGADSQRPPRRASDHRVEQSLVRSSRAIIRDTRPRSCSAITAPAYMVQTPARHRRRHDVFIYAHDEAYFTHVVEFIAVGVRLGQRVVAITTASRWAEIASRLESVGIDHADGLARRTLIWTDADTALQRVVVGRLVDGPSFVSLLRYLLAGSALPYRMYGDAAGILAERDNLAGAVELEHAAAPSGAVYVSCGYRPHEFSDDILDWGVRTILNAHDDAVIEPRAWTGSLPGDETRPVTRPAERILLWDDHTDSRHMYAEALTFSGYQVMTAVDASQALAFAVTYRPDAVVLDVRMPRKTGTTILRTLRQQHAFEAPILALTAHAFPAERQEFADDGFDTVLSKPCAPDVLVGAVSDALNRSPRQRRPKNV